MQAVVHKPVALQHLYGCRRYDGRIQIANRTEYWLVRGAPMSVGRVLKVWGFKSRWWSEGGRGHELVEQRRRYGIHLIFILNASLSNLSRFKSRAVLMLLLKSRSIARTLLLHFDVRLPDLVIRSSREVACAHHRSGIEFLVREP